MNIFEKLFTKEHNEPQTCSCEEEVVLNPIVHLYSEMYGLASTITDSEIEEGNILAMNRKAEIDTHMNRMMALFSMDDGEI